MADCLTDYGGLCAFPFEAPRCERTATMATYNLTQGDDILGIDPFRYPSDDPGPYVVKGRGGNDQIVGGNFNDRIYGGEGNDSLAGARGANVVYGGNGDDYLQIYNEGDIGPNADLLADSVFGEAGDDSIQFILGGESVAHSADGGDGIDTLAISFETRSNGSGQVYLYDKLIDLRGLWKRGVGKIDSGTVRNIEIVTSISGGQGNDTIIVGNYSAPFYPGTTRPRDLLIDGNNGDDTISGGASYDQINGGAGSDTIFGNDGDDYLAAGPSTAGAGNDLIRGGKGNDTINGGGGNDRLFGDAGDDNVQAQDGNDAISGGAGKDFLSGGEGDDTVQGGAGDDQIYGGGGTNKLYGDADNDSLFGAEAVDYLRGGTGGDFIFGAGGKDKLFGDAGDDTLQGGNGADVLYGGDGADTLDETVQDDSSNDSLFGDAGDDILRGGGGADRLSGGAGADTLTGGAGGDRFLFTSLSAIDTIADFSRDEGDKIALSKAVFTAFAANTKLTASAFHSGAGVDTAHDASDRILYNTTTGALWYDPDGTGASAAQKIAVLGDASHPVLSYGDFLIIA
jgi:Ca2+-binding RTX toxin-like protein